MYYRFICTRFIAIGLYVLQVYMYSSYMYYRFICTIGLYVL